MYAGERSDCMFKAVDEAVATALNSKPERALICVLGAMLSSVFSVLYVQASRFGKVNRVC